MGLNYSRSQRFSSIVLIMNELALSLDHTNVQCFGCFKGVIMKRFENICEPTAERYPFNDELTHNIIDLSYIRSMRSYAPDNIE